MLIDSGSRWTYIDSSFAQRLKLPSSGSLTAESLFFAARPADRVTIDRLSIGDFVVRQRPALAMDLSDISRDLLRDDKRRIEVIVGLDVLCRLKSLSVDYSSRNLTMVTGGSGENEQCVGQLVAVNIQVNGRASVFMVDSGSDGGIEVFGEGHTGFLKTVLSSVDTGIEVLKNQPALIIPRPRGTTGLAGIIGSGAMRFLRIDFQQGTVRVNLADRQSPVLQERPAH